MTNEKDREEAYGLPTHYDDGDLVDDIREKKHGSYGTEFDLDYPIACARVRQYCARIRAEAVKAERERYNPWLLTLRYYINNPSAWQHFDQSMSDNIETCLQNIDPAILSDDHEATPGKGQGGTCASCAKFGKCGRDSWCEEKEWEEGRG